MFDAFFPTTAELPLPPPPKWMESALTVVGILSVLLPAGPVRLSSGGLMFGLCFYLCVWTAAETRDGYTTGSGCIIVLYRWIDLVLLHNAERDFWQVGKVDTGTDANHDRVTVEVRAPQGKLAKVRWFAGIFWAFRGVGWNVRETNIPAAVSKSTRTSHWLLNTWLHLVVVYFQLDIASTILMHTTRTGSFFDQPLIWQLSVAWLKAFISYSIIEIAFYVPALMTVAIGYYTPQDWPPVTGSFRKDAYTVRKMWGTCWHQLMRRPCSEAGRVFKQFFRIKKGTFMSRYSQLWVGFFVSMLQHHAGAVVGMHNDAGYWQMVYFMLQPAGIMLEDFAIFVGKRMGLKESVWTKRIGFVWVILWFSWSLRFMVCHRTYSWEESYTLPSFSGYMLNRLEVAAY